MTPPPPRRGMVGTRGRLKRMLYILAAIYIGWCLLLYTQQDRMMFPRDMLNAPSPEAAIPRSVERLWIEPEPGGACASRRGSSGPAWTPTPAPPP